MTSAILGCTCTPDPSNVQLAFWWCDKTIRFPKVPLGTPAGVRRLRVKRPRHNATRPFGDYYAVKTAQIEQRWYRMSPG